jgi:hypothetical protein
VPFSELGQRERLGREHQMAERAELGEGEADLAEGALRPSLDRTGGVEEQQSQGTARYGVATVGHDGRLGEDVTGRQRGVGASLAD